MFPRTSCCGRERCGHCYVSTETKTAPSEYPVQDHFKGHTLIFILAYQWSASRRTRITTRILFIRPHSRAGGGLGLCVPDCI